MPPTTIAAFVILTSAGLTAAGCVDDPNALPLVFSPVEALSSAGAQWLPQADERCGTWARMTGGAAAADFDGDGRVDLFLPRVDAPSALLWNTGTGFQDRASELGLDAVGSSNGALWVDVDGDGALDLVVTQFRSERTRLFMQRSGRFVDEGDARLPRLDVEGPEYAWCSAMFSASAADIDGDGDLDLHINSWHPDPGSAWRGMLLLNDGTGVFQDVTLDAGLEGAGHAGFTSSFADIDDDGDVDLLIAADFGQSQLYFNDGAGHFEDRTTASGVGTDENGMGSALGDIDGDGDLDWFVTAISATESGYGCRVAWWGCSGNRLYINDGDGTFADETDRYGVRLGGWGWGADFWDVDSDGDLDLGMGAGSAPVDTTHPSAALLEPYASGPVTLWLNTGEPPMQRSSAFDDMAGSFKAFIPFDVDGDLDHDLVLTRNADTPLLVRNDSPPQRALVVRLEGRANRYGIGARVILERSDGRELRRDVTANATFLGHGPPQAHFGLGARSRASRLRVRWPGSIQEQVWELEESIAEGGIITLTEQ